MSELKENDLANLSGVTPGGRLTLTSGTPVTSSDVTGATTIYYTPHVHNIVTLWTGTMWYPVQFSETSLALGTLTSGKPYDVFGYLNSGSLALESLVWTNDTARATAVTIQGGRYCKSGDKTRRYLGTFYTSSTTTTEDSSVKRYLFNMYNRVTRYMSVIDSTDSWTYSTAAYRQSNNSSANQLAYVDGVGGVALSAISRSLCLPSISAGYYNSGVGIDSTTVNSGYAFGSKNSSTAIIHYFLTYYAGIPGVGRHTVVWLEQANGGGTDTWYGDAGAPTAAQAGIVATVHGM